MKSIFQTLAEISSPRPSRGINLVDQKIVPDENSPLVHRLGEITTSLPYKAWVKKAYIRLLKARRREHEHPGTYAKVVKNLCRELNEKFKLSPEQAHAHIKDIIREKFS